MKPAALLLCPIILLGVTEPSSAVGTLTTLSALDSGTSSTPYVLSANGSIVVGSSFSGSAQVGTVWSGSGYGTRSFVGRSVDHSEVTGVSASGAVIAGIATVSGTVGGFVKVSGGSLQVIDGTVDAPTKYRVSGDGQTVVGYYQPVANSPVPARWKQATGMQVLSGLESRLGVSGCVSANGTAVGGYLVIGNFSNEEAFVWSESGGPTTLPKLHSNLPTSYASDMSSDGLTLVGSGRATSSIDEAVRWRNTGGVWSVQPLGFLSGSTFGFATAISGDGTLIGGACGSDEGAPEVGFLWTQAGGMVTISQYASSFGIDVSGWQFQRVMDISADGSTLCCVGLLNNTAYGVVITVPAPGAVAALFTAAVGLGLHRRRSR
jgi:uncharacterized membrane protein